MTVPKEWQVAVKHTLPISAAMITSFVTQNPYWAYAIYSAVGLYGVFMDANQERLNELFQFVLGDPELFAEEIVSTEEFKQGFIIVLSEYLKARAEEKREVAQRIFIGFTSSKDKGRFKLEKLYSTLSNISLEGIEYLKFLNEEIIPLQQAACEKEVKDRTEKNVSYDPELGRMNFFRDNTITRFIAGELDKKFGINNEEAKKTYAHITDEHEQINAMSKDMKRAELEVKERKTELVSLGLWNSQTKSRGLGTFGGGSISNEGEFTQFGREFLSFITPSK